jgi:hypothetical protein
LDFDLQRSTTRRGERDATFQLHPLLRLVDNSRAGAVEGAIQEIPESCAAAAVYVFEGHSVTPDDIDLKDKDDVDPVTTAVVVSDGVWSLYQIAILSPGDYTVAFTCDAGRDDPESNDVLVFSKSTNLTVEAQKTVVRDL